ncbi:MAG: nucleotidyltransferase domain-containing protein [Candidatus Symbiobacter sp.]|nr:nucleotidyltransferase domain-containing protein [Candidatus Symbiobacter sp.]
MSQNIFSDRSKLETICRRHHIHKLSLIGSRLNGTARNESDFDVLVEFEAGQKPGLFGLIETEMELSQLVGGKVDLLVSDIINPYARQNVTHETSIQYVSQ